MTMFPARFFRPAAAAVALLFAAFAAHAQQPQGPARARFDVTHYRIEAELNPAQHTLRAGADVTFTP